MNTESMMAEYIFSNDKEVYDYQKHCDENNIVPFDLRGRDPIHILEHAATALHNNGYDVDGWFFKNRV